MDNYVVRKATYEEANGLVSKYIANGILNDSVVLYIGLLDDKVVSQAVAYLLTKGETSPDELLLNNTCACISDLKTKEEYQNKGYASRLFKYILNDLKSRGISKVTLGIDKNNQRNKDMYSNWGFNDYIKTTVEDNISYDWYSKNL